MPGLKAILKIRNNLSHNANYVVIDEQDLRPIREILKSIVKDEKLSAIGAVRLFTIFFCYTMSQLAALKDHMGELEQKLKTSEQELLNMVDEFYGFDRDYTAGPHAK